MYVLSATISFFLIPIQLQFHRKVWNCLTAKINTATIEFWYNSYRTCNDINVVCLASQNITSPPKKVVWQSNKHNFLADNISAKPNISDVLASIELDFYAMVGFILLTIFVLLSTIFPFFNCHVTQRLHNVMQSITAEYVQNMYSF